LNGANWFNETLYPEFRQSLRMDKVLFEDRSEFQHIVVFENAMFGRVLTLDGVVQTTERDEFCYHEMISHVPIVAHGAAKDVLIIGGGDGGALREVLKHPVEKAVMVELDDYVVKLCKEHMPSLSDGAFDDPRAEIIFADGIDFARSTDRRFDVIIVDSTDPIGPGEVLFTREFYADCARMLTGRGILITQSGVAFMQQDEAASTFGRMKGLFADAALYVAQVPTYAAGFMTLGWGSHSAEPRQTAPAEIARRIDALKLVTRYYNAGIHAAAFSLPNYMRALQK
jgi:spermidine synthase